MSWLSDQWQEIRSAGTDALESLGEGVTEGITGAIGAHADRYNQPETGEDGQGRTLTQQQNPNVNGSSGRVASSMPGWVMPVAIGGGVLVVVGLVVVLVRK